MDREDWKFKEDAESQGSSDGFWYDLTVGGYINPKEVLTDSKQIAELEEAIALIRSFEEALEDNDLMNEL